MFSNDLSLYLKDLKLLSLEVSALKSVASSFDDAKSKSKSSASTVVVPSIFVIHLVNDAQC